MIKPEPDGTTEVSMDHWGYKELQEHDYIATTGVGSCVVFYACLTDKGKTHVIIAHFGDWEVKTDRVYEEEAKAGITKIKAAITQKLGAWGDWACFVFTGRPKGECSSSEARIKGIQNGIACTRQGPYSGVKISRVNDKLVPEPEAPMVDYQSPSHNAAVLERHAGLAVVAKAVRRASISPDRTVPLTKASPLPSGPPLPAAKARRASISSNSSNQPAPAAPASSPVAAPSPQPPV